MVRLKLNFRESILPGSAILLGVGLVLSLLLLVRTTQTVKAEIQMLEHRAQELSVQSSGSVSERSLAEVEEFLKEWEAGQVRPTDIPQLVSFLGESLQRRHLRLVKYSPKEWVSLGWLQWCDMRFELVGSSVAIVAWLGEFSRKGYPVVVKSCELTKLGEGNDEVRCILEFSIYSEKSG
ncbi:hypothetical protein [Thermogutta sp.]|uniref:hypothetical protein n=1 Tax=Thermogutta sp. TaxID=1962930 RepID=UPI00321FDB17